MTTLRRILTATALVALATSVASATTITETKTVASLSGTGTSSFLGFNSFSIAGATLNGVSFDFAFTGTASATLFNNGNPSITYTAMTASLPLTISANSGANVNNTTLSAGPFTGVDSTQGPTTVGSSNVSGDLIVAEFFTGLSNYTSAFSIAETIGSASVGGTINPAQNSFAGGNALVGGTVTVTYDYSIVSGTPEPATLALMGSALLGLGLFGKRFAKR